MIKRGNEKLGYFIYNGLNNIIEEIVLKDYSIINEVVSSFSCMINNQLGLKVTLANKEVLPFIDKSLPKEEYFEKTYKVTTVADFIKALEEELAYSNIINYLIDNSSYDIPEDYLSSRQ